MSEENISEFISDCVKQGFCLPEQIKEKALERIRIIDDKIAEADRLRPERSDMISVIKSFGGEIPKPATKRVIPINDNLSTEELDQKTITNIKLVCAYIEKHGSATPRDLMTALGVTAENDSEVYSVIKWLCIKGIASKREKDRALIQGTNWANRPKK